MNHDLRVLRYRDANVDLGKIRWSRGGTLGRDIRELIEQISPIGCGSSKSRTPQKPWQSGHRPDSLSAMRKMLILLLVALLHRLDRALAASYFESLAVRQQLAVLNRKTLRPQLHPSDRWFWVPISSFWPDWRDALAIQIDDLVTSAPISNPPKTEHVDWLPIDISSMPIDGLIGVMSQDGATIISGGGEIAVAFSNSRSPREYEFATDRPLERGI